MKASALSRSFELAKILAKVGLQEARSGNLQTRMEQAKIIADGLSQLKGAALKAGQLLSIDISDAFPKEAQLILSQLQSAVTPVEFSEVEKVLKLELQKDLQKIQNLDPKPVGSASFGQVHRGRYQDRDIVVKVQYPRVAGSIQSDLKILKSIAAAFCKLTGREMDLNPLFNELKTILVQEVDYLQEAEFQKAYRRNVQSLNDTKYSFEVPEVFSELSTARVLTMEWMQGIPLRVWMQSNHPKEQREYLAHALLNLYCHEFIDWGLVQTDPNFGNFLVNTKGPMPSLVLLDFGACKEYSPAFRDQYSALLRAAFNKDHALLKQEAIEFGLIDERESDEAFDAFFELVATALKPFFSTVDQNAIFEFTDQTYAKQSSDVVRNLAAKMKYSPPPANLVFLHRKLGGIYSMLKNLDVAIDVSPYWKRMMGEA